MKLLIADDHNLFLSGLTMVIRENFADVQIVEAKDYNEIFNKLYEQENNTYEFSKLNKLSRETKIPYKHLISFIEYCSKLYDNNGITVLSKNNKIFWSNHILIKKQQYMKKKRTLKHLGRKKVGTKDSIKIKGAELVNITASQYSTLEQRYGHIFIDKAIIILNEWLKTMSKTSKKYLNKNNYGHFRSDSWIIMETKKLLDMCEFQPINTPDGIINIYKVM